MARGWESKAVESQIEDRARPGVAEGPASKEARARAERRSVCELSRARVLAELGVVRSEARRTALRSALATLEAELNALSAQG